MKSNASNSEKHCSQQRKAVFKVRYMYLVLGRFKTKSMLLEATFVSGSSAETLEKQCFKQWFRYSVAVALKNKRKNTDKIVSMRKFSSSVVWILELRKSVFDSNGFFFSSLKGTIRRSSGTKIKQCPWEGCGKVFPWNADLRRHYVVHTGEKPYKCPLCQHACNVKHNLVTHIKARHPEYFSKN